MLAHLEEFRIFELPLLAGVSRKSMIYRLLGTTPQEALNGTTVLDTICLLKGADILRVHDVREAVAMADRIALMARGVIESVVDVPATKPRRLSDPATAALEERILGRLMTLQDG